MNKRVLQFANPAHLSTRHGQLEITSKDTGEVTRRDPQDILMVELDNQQITLTQAALQTLLQHNVVLTICDSRHLPAGLLLPLEGHTLHQLHLRAQATTTDKLKGLLWQKLVAAKLRNQAALLTLQNQAAERLRYLAERVAPADPDNHESQGAVYYWPLVFANLGQKGFRRIADADEGPHRGANLLLNYGYAVLRAIAARALTGAGLHPGLGVHHQNQYNAYALADDMMEPLRPMVDLLVIYRLQQAPPPQELTRADKADFLLLATHDVRLGSEHMSIGEAAGRMAAQMAQILLDKQKADSWQMPSFPFDTSAGKPKRARKTRSPKADE